MSNKYLIDSFTEENDSSAEEYKRSLIEYLFRHLENRDVLPPISSNQETIDGAKDMLREVIEVINGDSQPNNQSTGGTE